MSYIRCLSNPESLYIYGGADDKIHFSWTDRQGELQFASCPYADFNELFKKAKEQEFPNWEDSPVVAGSLSAREVVYDNNTHKEIVDEDADQQIKEIISGQRKPTNHLICLQIGDAEPLYLWMVTWDYLSNNVLNRSTTFSQRFGSKLRYWWWNVRDFFCGEDENEQ